MAAVPIYAKVIAPTTPGFSTKFASRSHSYRSSRNDDLTKDMTRGRIVGIIDLVVSFVWFGGAIIGGIMGQGWSYVAAPLVLYAGSLLAGFLLFIRSNKTKAVQFWLCWTTLRFIGEWIIVIVYWSLEVNGKENESSVELDKSKATLVTWIITVLAYECYYLLVIVPMCGYREAIERNEASAADFALEIKNSLQRNRKISILSRA